MSTIHKTDVVVIGAGMAGLAAARVVAEAGRRVLVLEAQARVGGRISTVHDGGEVIELGAEFIHGRPPELWALIDEAGLATYERVGAFMRVTDHGPVEEDDDDDTRSESLVGFAGPDCSFAEFTTRLGLGEDEMRQAIGFVEGFNAADAREASVLALARQQRAEDEVSGERSWRVTDGYDRLPEFLRERVLAAGGEVMLKASVSEVVWSPGSAAVRTRDGRVFQAEQVVVTLPLGTLQAEVVRFVPAPEKIMQAAARMRMGQVCRVTLQFRQRIWPEEMSFLLARDSLPTVWWSERGKPGNALTLTGWVGGPRAAPLIALATDELRDRAVLGLAQALAIDAELVRNQLVDFHMHDWHGDRWTRGAYSWVPVGGLDASSQMTEPVANTLYFAGEHTDTTGHWGTVHAALRSGLRAGRQVVER